MLFISLLLLSSIEVEKIKELSEREIAARGVLELSAPISSEKFQSCLPYETDLFPKEFSAAQEKKIFVKSELKDLMECDPDDCAFNFLPYELEYLKNLKTEDARKQAYYGFFRDRTTGRTPIDPSSVPRMIRAKEKAFSACASKELDELLDKRPLKNVKYRVGTVQYQRKMRPTTRLTQAVTYRSSGAECVAEAIIFSDHYDADLVQVWSMVGKKIQLETRHRLDFLNSWWRRTQKGKLQTSLETVMEERLERFQSCLEGPVRKREKRVK